MTVGSCEFESHLLHNKLKSVNVTNAEIAQLVEHNLAKVRVAGSSPVFRSKRQMRQEQGVIKSGWRNW